VIIGSALLGSLHIVSTSAEDRDGASDGDLPELRPLWAQLRSTAPWVAASGVFPLGLALVTGRTGLTELAEWAAVAGLMLALAVGLWRVPRTETPAEVLYRHGIHCRASILSVERVPSGTNPITRSQPDFPFTLSVEPPAVPPYEAVYRHHETYFRGRVPGSGTQVRVVVDRDNPMRLLVLWDR